jgi:polyisoprenoid-binding protein YceI
MRGLHPLEYGKEIHLVERLAYCFMLLATLEVAAAHGVPEQTATRNSTITIHVGKTGLFSGLGHNHTISAPISRAIINPQSKSASITVLTKEMKVLDPEASEKDRQEIQATMMGPKVLDAQKYPEIHFTSTHVEQTSAGEFKVTGNLELHGVTKQLEFPVTGTPEHYTGKAKLKQTDFGIQPVSAGGGTVKVKDEIELEFNVYPEVLHGAAQ